MLNQRVEIQSHQDHIDQYMKLIDSHDVWELLEPGFDLPQAIADLLVRARIVSGYLGQGFSLRWIVDVRVRGLELETPADAAFVVREVLGLTLCAAEADRTLSELRGQAYQMAVSRQPKPDILH